MRIHIYIDMILFICKYICSRKVGATFGTSVDTRWNWRELKRLQCVVLKCHGSKMTSYKMELPVDIK
jgi:hypothetical protein